MIIWYNCFGDNMLDEIIKLDSTFTESSFKTKVDNIFVMLHTSLMTDNLKSVAHFINDKVYSEFDNRLQELNNNNRRQMFDELNVKSTEIENVEITNDKYIITVRLISRYLDYIMDKNSGKVISGDTYERVEKTNILTFEKSRNTDK